MLFDNPMMNFMFIEFVLWHYAVVPCVFEAVFLWLYKILLANMVAM